MTALATAAAPRAARLVARAEAVMARELLVEMIRREFPGRIAVVSSFGIESAVLLHLVASIDPGTPILFLDTEKLFGETLLYRDALIRRLALRDVRTLRPDPARLAAEDPAGTLWRTNPGRCCQIRKVEPLAEALAGFDAWINGRKRYHGGARTGLPLIEVLDGRVKINPLASWTEEHIGAYVEAYDLPPHPLAADGYSSIGCRPCSDRAQPGDGVRDGRWRGREKTECGIHLPQLGDNSRRDV